MSKQLILGLMNDSFINLLNAVQLSCKLSAKNPKNKEYKKLYNKNISYISSLFGVPQEVLYMTYYASLENKMNFEFKGSTNINVKRKTQKIHINYSFIELYSVFFQNIDIKNADDYNAVKRFFNRFLKLNFTYKRKGLEYTPYGFNDFLLLNSIGIRNAFVCANFLVNVHDEILFRKSLYPNLTPTEKNELLYYADHPDIALLKAQKDVDSFFNNKTCKNQLKRLPNIGPSTNSSFNNNVSNKKAHSNIRVKDFVVRRTTFKCIHDAHKLQNVDGIITLIDKKGNLIEKKITAGYCSNCNVYFIMESTYQSLKKFGTPVCRISDEKNYIKNMGSINGMHLAQESILMQYGYNVDQKKSLSSIQRKKILSLLIDNEILTKPDIISYLDFFINQRKYQSKYEKAIEKWENDRDFISDYNIGNYKTYGIGGIYNNTQSLIYNYRNIPQQK